MAKLDIKNAIKYYKGDDGEYVAIPKTDISNGSVYPDCRVNDFEFKAGKTYYCHPDVAKEVERITEVHDNMMRRLNSSSRNLEALLALEPRGAALGLDVVRE